MKTTSEEQIAFNKQKKLEQYIMKVNGHYGYQLFTGKRLTSNIDITGISLPLNKMPTVIGFIDPALISIVASNDSTNPDGSSIPAHINSVVIPVTLKSSVVSKPKLKIIK